MDALTGIKDDVRFNYEAADALAGEFRSSAEQLRDQTGGRSRLASDALKRWDGRYADMFEQRQTQAAQQASGLARALDQAARDVEALKQAAQEEQDRREQAREWQEEHKEDIEDWYDGLQFWEDDRPPVGPPKDPPVSHPPEVKTLGQPFDGARGPMDVSSAAPADLDAYVKGARAADDDLERHQRKLPGLHKDFVDGCGWGKFDATSLITAFGQYLKLNEQEAQRVSTIAADFRRAGGEGPVKSLPDAAIEASLRAKGLAGGRSALTFTTASAYGFPPTTGYANDPVNTASGNFIEAETDLRFGGLLSGLESTRTYNSRSERVGPFGRGWASWATARLHASPEGAEYEGPDGRRVVFPRLGAGTAGSPASARSSSRSTTGSHWTGSAAAAGSSTAPGGRFAR